MTEPTTLPVDPAALERVLLMDGTQRGTYGVAVRDTLLHLGLITRETAAELAGQTGVPEELRSMSARDRGVWLSVERAYNAIIRAEGVEKNERTMTPYADLVPDAQQALVVAMLPVFQMLHSVALNPAARREETGRG